MSPCPVLPMHLQQGHHRPAARIATCSCRWTCSITRSKHHLNPPPQPQQPLPPLLPPTPPHPPPPHTHKVASGGIFDGGIVERSAAPAPAFPQAQADVFEFAQTRTQVAKLPPARKGRQSLFARRFDAASGRLRDTDSAPPTAHTDSNSDSSPARKVRFAPEPCSAGTGSASADVPDTAQSDRMLSGE